MIIFSSYSLCGTYRDRTTLALPYVLRLQSLLVQLVVKSACYRNSQFKKNCIDYLQDKEGT